MFPRSLLIESLVERYGSALHGEAMHEVLFGDTSKPLTVTFTRYEEMLDPKPCACRGCVWFRAHRGELYARLEAMPQAEWRGFLDRLAALDDPAA